MGRNNGKKRMMNQRINGREDQENIAAKPCALENVWMGDAEFQVILHATHLIAFEFNPKTGEEHVSPFISEYIAGNYDGRFISDVMLEDDVIYPDDIERSLEFRRKVKAGVLEEVALRLKTPEGNYRWFKMRMTEFRDLYIGVFVDVHEEICQREALRYRAEFDVVSGISNRITFYENTQKMLREAPDTLHYLIRFDVERFKLINEMYTMAEGDKVLGYIGTVIQMLAFPGETYGRLNNDVFCMCVTRNREELMQLIEEIEIQGNAYPLEFQFIFSIGILEIKHYEGESINILCDHAAIAQRTVKGNYVQRFAFYDNAMSRAMERDHDIISRMEAALANKEFQIYMQPRYDMVNKKIAGAEALVRWETKSGKVLMPGEFIPLFEHNGFILRMDEYVWKLTCKTIRSWMDRGLKIYPVSVNVSRLHLHDSAFCDKMVKFIEKYKIPPEYLELEITESAYAESPQNLYHIMDSLQSRGFHFLMDDFGSGYSSLNSLKDIPVDIIKIDMNFLRESRRGADVSFNILRGTIQLIQGLGIPFIVEGVETREQEQFLLEEGCQEAQGYYYAKPMRVEEYEKLIENQ